MLFQRCATLFPIVLEGPSPVVVLAQMVVKEVAVQQLKHLALGSAGFFIGHFTRTAQPPQTRLKGLATNELTRRFTLGIFRHCNYIEIKDVQITTIRRAIGTDTAWVFGE